MVRKRNATELHHSVLFMCVVQIPINARSTTISITHAGNSRPVRTDRRSIVRTVAPSSADTRPYMNLPRREVQGRSSDSFRSGRLPDPQGSVAQDVDSNRNTQQRELLPNLTAFPFDRGALRSIPHANHCGANISNKFVSLRR